MRKFTVVAIVAAAVLALAGLASAAEESNPAALAKALVEAKVSLAQGLKASASVGKPISGKYELEKDALYLSVYTQKGKKFSEVVIDHKTGAITKSETITDSGDLKEAKEQSQAMAKAKRTLQAAVMASEKANAGYRAVIVEPTIKGGHPVAEVTLMKGADVKTATEKLD